MIQLPLESYRDNEAVKSCSVQKKKLGSNSVISQTYFNLVFFLRSFTLSRLIFKGFSI